MVKKLVEPLPEDVVVPHHVAIIPDGNRRWARERGLPVFEGHRRGFEITPKLVRAARELGIHTLTIWAFSTENWNRSEAEVKYLMKMYEWFIGKHLAEAKKEGARIYHLGRKDRIPKRLAEKMARAEGETANNDKYVLNIALDYGGHDEILRAISRWLEVEHKQRKSILRSDARIIFAMAQIIKSVNRFAEYLDTRGQPHPDPDLIIRTSGEQRTSGLFSWQAAYAEFYFESDHFPDFSPKKLRQAIIDYANRHRRFGGN